MELFFRQNKMNTLSKLYVKLNREHISALAIICLLYHSMFNAGINVIVSRVSSSLVVFAMPVLISFEGLLVYGSLFAYVNRNILFCFFTYATIILLYVYTFLCFPENTFVLLGTVRSMALFCIPSLLVARYIDNFDLVWHYLHRFSYIIILFGLLYVYSGRMEDLEREYSMWLGYQLTIPSMTMLWNAVSPRNSIYMRMVDFLFFTLGVTTIVLYGSRAPILIIALYFIYITYANINNMNTNSDYKLLLKLIMKVLFLALLFLIVLSLFDIELMASILYDFLQNYGIQSRTLRVLAIENSLSYVSGRNIIYSAAFELIKKNPLLGYGLVGDCVQIGKVLSVSPDLYSGMYAHNFYLALIIHFGILVGSAIFFSFIHVIYKCFNNLSEDCYSRLFIIMLFSTFIQVMFSGNYLTLASIWLLLGIALNRKTA